MISVQNHRQRSNGSNHLRGQSGVFLVLLFFFFAGCKPRVVVLDPSTPPKEVVSEAKTEEATPVEVVRDFQSIALVLPFQLDRVRPNAVSVTDLRRSELALDFYQGFELAMQQLSEAGNHFDLHVFDSRDDERYAAGLAKDQQMRDAALVIGPVFPKEITAFSQNTNLDPSKVLQVSPLAATRPSEFNISNLVTITAPITTHIQALAMRINAMYKREDVIIFYTTNDASSRQFLPLLKQELLLLNSNILIQEVGTEVRLHEVARAAGNNIVVCGSDNPYQLAAIFTQLAHLKQDLDHRVKLFGHPTWSKLELPSDFVLGALDAEISSSYFIDKRSAEVRRFEASYQRAYGIAATEFAYKGYDTATYFGLLMQKYGDDYASAILKTQMDGLHNRFDFEFHSDWGYVNSSILFLQFNNGQFLLKK